MLTWNHSREEFIWRRHADVAPLSWGSRFAKSSLGGLVYLSRMYPLVILILMRFSLPFFFFNFFFCLDSLYYQATITYSFSKAFLGTGWNGVSCQRCPTIPSQRVQSLCFSHMLVMQVSWGEKFPASYKRYDCLRDWPLPARDHATERWRPRSLTWWLYRKRPSFSWIQARNLPISTRCLCPWARKCGRII